VEIPLKVRLVDLGSVYNGTQFIVPDEFFAYRSLDSIVRSQTETGIPLIQFGVIGLDVPVYLDGNSQKVLYGLEAAELKIVNTSISRFTQCVVRMSEMFPFYSEDSDVDDWEAGARNVENVIREIDPDAYCEGSYWYEFRWDVSMGDFHD
jgi:hypothetical protein